MIIGRWIQQSKKTEGMVFRSHLDGRQGFITTWVQLHAYAEAGNTDKEKCDLPDCVVQQWLSLYPGTTGDITTVLGLEQPTNVNNIITLHHDPFMFHQANLRKTGASLTTVNGTPGNFSLLQMWVETIVAEYIQLSVSLQREKIFWLTDYSVTWPLITLKHDDVSNLQHLLS